ncbi:MAG: hypothetical protein M0042_15850 [Nitrospiraceae bacterium]|nr:hypothetical protein [Nitrospiraceae bacterium]
MRDRGKITAPECPFCGAELHRPVESPATGLLGGTCTCGAFYLVDPTGKDVGTIMSEALIVTADRLGKNFTDLTPGEDYDDAVLSYDVRFHRSPGKTDSFMDGYGRLYIIRLKGRKQ